MTLLGVLFLFAIFICFILPYRYLVYLLLFSCIFSASSIINISGKSIQPYLFCSFFYLIKAFLIQIQNSRKFNNKLSAYCLVFLIYASIASILFPFIFEGIIILPKNLDTGIAYGGEKLGFSLNNIAQIVYVIINILTVCYLYLYRKKINNKSIKKVFIYSVITVLVIGILDYLSKSYGIFNFPTNLLLNSYNMNSSDSMQYNTTIMGFMRFSSLFTEASYCGAFLSAAFWSLKAMVINDKKINLLLFTCLICSIFTFSATAIVSFFFGFIIYIIKSKQKLGILFLIVLFVSTCTYLFLQTYIGTIIYDILSTKLESQSGEVRSLSIIYSLRAIMDSYFLGIGFGSTRSTSFLFDLIASVGIIGSLYFYFIYKKLLFTYKSVKDFKYIYTYAITLMFSQILAIPDFSFSCFWLGLYIAATYNNNENLIRTNITAVPLKSKIVL